MKPFSKAYSLSSRIFAILLGLVLTAQFVVATEKVTEPNRGFNPGKSYAISDIESIAMQSGNMMLNLPLGALPAGRGGMSAGVSLFYNSKLWKKNSFDLADGDGNEMPAETLDISQDGGWHYGYKYYFRVDPAGVDCSTGGIFGNKIQLVMPDGGTHTLVQGDGTSAISDADNNSAIFPDGRGYCSGTAVTPGQTVRLFSVDGSFLRMEVTTDSDTDFNNNQWTLYTADGSRVVNLPNVVNSNPQDGALTQRIYDRNDNFIDILENSANSDYSGRRTTILRDTVGRKVAIEYDAATGEDQIHSSGFNGAEVVTRVLWKGINVNRKYVRCGCSAPSPAPPDYNYNFPLNKQFSVVDKIYLPSQIADGSLHYEFAYNADDTTAQDAGWGEINHIRLPSAATSDYEYQQDTNSSNPYAWQVLANGVTKKTLFYKLEYDGTTTPTSDVWTYQRTTPTGGADDSAIEGQVTGPDGGTTKEYYTNPNALTSYPVQGETYKTVNPDGSVVEKWYASNAPGTPTTPDNVMTKANRYVKYEFVSIPNAAGSLNLTAAKEYTRDKNGNVLTVKEYDYMPPSYIHRNGDGLADGLQSGASSYLKRVTVSDYYYQTPEASQASYSDSNIYTYSTSQKIKGAVKSTEVQNASGTPQSRSEMFYDNSATPTNGNLTQTQTWDSFKSGSSKAYSNPLTSTNSISTSASYDSYGNPTLTTDANGNQTQLTYGAVNGYTGLYPTQTIAAYGTSIARTSTTEYDFYTGVVKKVTDADNQVSTETEYDDLGRPTKTAAAVGKPEEVWTQTIYDDANRKVIVKSDLETKGDARKVATQFYDQLGRVRLSKTLEDAATQDATNETDGIKVQTRYLTSNPYTYQLTSNPYRAATSAEAGSEQTMGWTRSTTINTGKHSEVETFAGAALPQPFLTSGYNTNSTGIVKTDLDADRTLVTDQAGRQRISKTNALGQLINVWEIKAADDDTEAISFGSPLVNLNGIKTSYQYDPLNNLTTVNQGVQQRNFSYSSLSRLVSANNPESGMITYQYDNNGNLTKKKDARLIEIVYGYDPLNRVTQRSYSNEPSRQASTPAVNYTYDAVDGNPSAPYAKGKLTKVSSDISETRYTGFDALGRILSSEQRTTDAQRAGTEPAYASSYKYNMAGALIEQTYPSTRVVKNVLDTNGDLAVVQSQKNSNSGFWNYAEHFTYNPAGAVTSMQLGNGRWESTQFNSRLQPVQIVLGSIKYNLGLTDPETNLLKLNYDYGSTQNNGNVLSQSIKVPTEVRNNQTYNGFTATQNYTYDELNRLKQATETIPNETGWQQTNLYDRYGNRTFDEPNTTTLPKNCINGTQQIVCQKDNPSANVQDNRLSGVSYDDSGNTTQDANSRKFTYDAENKQTKVETINNGTVTGLVGQYWYDGDGKRVRKYALEKEQWTETVFVYDAFGKLIAEYSSQIATPQNATVSYLTNDNLGSPRINTDQNGQVTARHDYQPFGEEILRTSYGADDVRKQFTSYERDIESSLDFAEARYFNFNHGRFTSTDPLLESGKIEDPQSWNRYAYALNSPLFYTDPTGMYVCNGIKTQCDQFETRLNEAKEYLKKVEATYGKDSDQYRQVNNALNAYGAKDEKNGVFVAFDRKGSGARTTGTFADNGKGELQSITVHFNAKALDKDSSQAIVGHEGDHVNYFQTVGNNTKDERNFEFRGHFVQSLLAEAQFGRFANGRYWETDNNGKEYDIWNSAWKGPDKEAKRTNAINTWLNVPQNLGGYAPNPPPKPKPTRQRRRRG